MREGDEARGSVQDPCRFRSDCNIAVVNNQFSAFSTRTLEVKCPRSAVWIGRVAAGSAEYGDVAQPKAREILIIDGDSATATSAAAAGSVSTLGTNSAGSAKSPDVNADAAAASSALTTVGREISAVGQYLTI
jgi:hypothetical protein